jgi:hypothetical protein
MKFKKSIKGKKVYGIMTKTMDGDVICSTDDIEKAKRSLDYNFPILVEMEITKAYTKNSEVIEIII